MLNNLLFKMFIVIPQNEDCVKTESGKWNKPCNVLVKCQDLGALISNAELIQCLDKEFLSPTVSAQAAIDVYRCKEFSLGTGGEFIIHHSNN